MKIIPSSLAVVCAIPSAHAALRGAETAAAASSSEAVINASGTNNSVGSSSRKLWNYEGYTYTNSGTYETRFCYYAESNNWIGPLYDSMLECCEANFASQTSGVCISKLPPGLQPSAQPSINGGGLPGRFAAVHANGYEDGYCSNLKADLVGVAEQSIFDTAKECCERVFPDQDYCLSQINDSSFVQPSGQPTLGAVAGLGLPGQFVAVRLNDYEDGYCSNLKEHVIGTPSARIYDTEFECCQENFADQTSGMCFSQLPDNLQPSGQPTLGAVAGLGLPAQYVAVTVNGFENGYCSNLKEHVIGTPSAQIYDTEFECCQENFADQTSGYCISQLPDNLQPSGQPTLGAVAGLGLPSQYVAVFANGYEDGYCSNLKEHVIGTPSAQIYDTEFECCQENFADQTSGYCVSQLPTNLQPSGQPTLGAVAGLGLSAQYVAVFANGYEDGYCSNLKEHVIGTPSAQIYETEFECCQENFADQTSGFCVSQLPTNLQPSGQPTLGAVAGLGLSAQYVAVFANGYEDGYCSNLKEHVIGTPSAQIYESEFECCQENFADQRLGFCISQLPTNLQPSGQPTLGAVAGLGLSAQYVAVFANGYEDGYCSNLKEHVIGTPSAQIYESEFECCQENFADQRLGYCISQLPTNLQPSGQPTSLNNGLLGLDVWVPVWPLTNSYESGYCSSKKEFVDVAYTQPFDSHLECCLKWFSMQNSGFCISEVEGGLLQPSSSPTIIGGGLKDAKFFPRFPGVGTPPATERYCDNDHNVLPQWQLDNYDSMGFDTQEECCDAWFPELTTACTRRLPTFGTLPPLPASCGFYPEYSSKWETGTCVNDCNHPPNFESVSNLLFSDDEAGGIECCNTWFENNGLTQQQIGSARLSYCLEQLVLANPTFAITAPPTRAPVS